MRAELGFSTVEDQGSEETNYRMKTFTVVLLVLAFTAEKATGVYIGNYRQNI